MKIKTEGKNRVVKEEKQAACDEIEVNDLMIPTCEDRGVHVEEVHCFLPAGISSSLPP
jgi:hypothetical protein